MIQFQNVSKNFGNIKALDCIDLTIEPGGITAILGPNGAGKTTAISLMLGLREPSAGRVLVDGLHPRDLRARSCMGAMLQQSGLPGHLRVRELIELFRTYYPNPMELREVVDAAGLEELVNARPGNLSGGELQRVYFALALCGNPSLLVLDEPSVGLDVAARRALLDTIAVISKQGRTIILTTHYLEEADALANRIVVINRGRILADGTPAQIKARAANKRVRYRAADGTIIEELTAQPEAMLAQLFARGEQISDLEVSSASLEDAFITLTAEETSHAA